jgi:hypothetical protein
MTEMLQLHQENSSVSIQTCGYLKEVHTLTETGAFMSPAYNVWGKCTVHERESRTLYTLVHQLALVGSHMKQASLRVQSGILIHCISSSCILSCIKDIKDIAKGKSLH